MGLQQAREELRALRVRGEIYFKEVDPSGKCIEIIMVRRHCYVQPRQSMRCSI